MALPVFVGAGSGTLITTGTGTVSKTGCTAGNLLVLHFMEAGTGNEYTRSNGVNITEITTGLTRFQVIQDLFGVGAPTRFHALAAARAVAGGTCSEDFTVGAGGADLFLRIYEFSGASASTVAVNEVFNNVGGGDGDIWSTSSGTSTTVSDAGVITADVDQLALQLVALANNQAVGDFTGETGGNWAEAVAEYSEAGGATATLQIQTAAMATAGTIDGGTLTITSTGWGVIGTSIVPAVTTSPTAADNPPIGILGRGAGW